MGHCVSRRIATKENLALQRHAPAAEKFHSHGQWSRHCWLTAQAVATPQTRRWFLQRGTVRHSPRTICGSANYIALLNERDLDRLMCIRYVTPMRRSSTTKKRAN